MGVKNRDAINLVRDYIRKGGKINLSMYFSRYPPIVLFPDILKIDKLRSPSGSQRKLSVFLLDPKFIVWFSTAYVSDNYKKLGEYEKEFKKLRFQVQIDVEEYERYFKEYQELINEMKGVMGEFISESRLVVGLGDESVYETSIRLLRNYGVPYIPGSTLKGVSKHWAIYTFTQLLQMYDEKFRSLDFFELAKGVQDSLDEGKRTIDSREIPSKKVKEKPEVFKGKTLSEIFTLLVETFGTRKKQGNVIFFDALSVPSSLRLELDVMNPHYPDYYQGDKPSGDWQNPNPIFFLAVPKGISFLVSVAPKNSASKLAQIAFEILKVALEDMGMGAKTSLGYGRLKFGGGRYHERKDS